MRRHADVVVVGGGPAGVAAAIAARQEGSKVLLIERYGFLGGTATSGMYGAFCGFYTSGELQEQIIKGCAEKVLELLRQKDALMGPIKSNDMVVLFYDLSTLKMVMDKMVLNAGADLMLHSQVYEVKTSGNKISSLKVVTKSGVIEVDADFIIDASGDGDIAALAGEAFNENENALQPGSMMFKMSNVDINEVLPFVLSGQLKEAMAEADKTGQYKLPRLDGNIIPQPKQGQVIISFSRIQVDGTNEKSLTSAELEGRTQVEECSNFLIDRIPGFKGAYVSEIATQIGIRESRRINGKYQLTLDDVLSGKKFNDSIGRCAWPVEKHLPGSKYTELTPLKDDDFYNLPFRSLIPKKTTNLLIAGRCSSATAGAQASSRVFAPSMAQGEACGIAASLCLKNNVNAEELDIKILQDKLIQAGALI